jgi:hypothetical protein
MTAARDPDFLTHETHESNEMKGTSGRRSACPADFVSFRVFSGRLFVEVVPIS